MSKQLIADPNLDRHILSNDRTKEIWGPRAHLPSGRRRTIVWRRTGRPRLIPMWVNTCRYQLTRDPQESLRERLCGSRHCPRPVWPSPFDGVAAPWSQASMRQSSHCLARRLEGPDDAETAGESPLRRRRAREAL